MPELPREYRPSAPEPKTRCPNAVPTLIDADRIPEGTLLSFEMKRPQEREYVGPWLAADARRGQATWVNHRIRPLLWRYDGQQYSPSGLVTKIREQSGWPDYRVSRHGPGQWHLTGEGSLWDLAVAIQDEQATEG